MFFRKLMRIPPNNKLSAGITKLIEEFWLTGNIGSTLFLKIKYKPEIKLLIFSITKNPPIRIRAIVRIFF